MVERRTLEPFVFLIFGLCLVVVFGLRVWSNHREFFSIDQQSAFFQTRTLTPEVGDTLREVLEQQRDLQLGFQRDVTGLGLGLLALVVGALSWLHDRPEGVDGQRKRSGSMVLPSSRHPRGFSLWDLGGLLVRTLIRVLLIGFVAISGMQLLRGAPPSLQLVDQGLTRTIDLLLTIARLVT